MEWNHLVFLIFLCFALVLECKAQGQCQHPCAQNEDCIHQKYQNTCFYLFEGRWSTWQDNYDFCRSQDMQMVKMTPELLRTVKHPIFENQGYKSKGAWLAGKARDLGGWKFLNNTSTDMLQHKSRLDAIRNDTGYCGHVTSHSVGYGAGACKKKLSFLCRFDKNGRFWNLKVIKEKKTWFEARTHCIQAGGDLFYMKEGEIEDEIRGHIEEEIRNASSNDGRLLHVGIVHRLWQWNDGSQIHHTKWAANEPNYGHEKCLMMYGDIGLWNDATCNSSKPTLCQKDAVTPTPTTRVTSTPTPKTSNAISNSPSTDGVESTSESSSHHIMDDEFDDEKNDFESSTLVYHTKGQSADAGNYTDNLPIILGVLLGVFFLTTILLLVFILCKGRKKKSDEETDVTPKSPYTETLSNGMTPASLVAANSQSHNAGHQQQNGLSRAQENENIMDEDQRKPAASPKPHIKPKPVIGPKTGDVYATVDRHVKPSHDNQDAHVYDNRTT